MKRQNRVLEEKEMFERLNEKLNKLGETVTKDILLNMADTITEDCLVENIHEIHQSYRPLDIDSILSKIISGESTLEDIEVDSFESEYEKRLNSVLDMLNNKPLYADISTLYKMEQRDLNRILFLNFGNKRFKTDILKNSFIGLSKDAHIQNHININGMYANILPKTNFENGRITTKATTYVTDGDIEREIELGYITPDGIITLAKEMNMNFLLYDKLIEVN